MGRIVVRMLGVAVAFLMLAGAAFADHMTGTYTGQGEVTGSQLVLQQNGNSVTGQVTGPDQAYLEGYTNGGDSVQGMIDLGQYGQYQFTAELKGNTFEITIYGQNGQVNYSFVRQGGQQPRPQPQPQPEPQPAPTGDEPAPPVELKFYAYVDGQQIGPLDMDGVKERIAAGDIDRSTLMWVPGAAEWTAASSFDALAALLPPAPPKPVQYYVSAAGAQIGPLSDQEIRDRIADGTSTGADLAWKAGLDAWAPLSSFGEFADALAAPPPLPPADNGGEASTDEPTPPPLPPGSEEPTPPPVDPAVETPEPAHEHASEEPAVDPAAPDGEQPPAPPSDQPAEEPTPVGEAPASPDFDATFAAFAEQRYPDADAEQMASFLACQKEVMATLSDEDRAALAASGFDPDPTLQTKLQADYPELEGGIRACVAEMRGTEPVGAPGVSIGLNDGRTLIVSGDGDSTTEIVDGGAKVTVGNTVVSYVGDVLEINGEVVEAPAFETSLEIKVAADGTHSLVADGK